MDLFKAFSKPSSKDIAKERLRLILINDRCSMPQEVLEDIKEDILEVLSKYMEINYAEIDVRMTVTEKLEEDPVALVANIPVKKVKYNK